MKPSHCRCGRFIGAVVCECRIQQVRRQMVSGKQFELCMESKTPVKRLPEPVIVWEE
jgi:hypothetical protein